MACNCEEYVDCGDTIEVDIINDTGGSMSTTHTINHEVKVTNLPITFLEKTTRNFSISFSKSNGSVISGNIVSCSDGFSLSCGGSGGGESASSSVSENCVRELNIPYYLDRLNEIFIYKSVREELIFSKSSNQLAAFKVKWPPYSTGKLCIPNNVVTNGVEKFIAIRKGIETILATKEYQYNPFPANDVGGGVWGLYGNVVDYGEAEPDTPDVSIILLIPNPPKQAQPLDNDVMYYGFYDYNAMQGGFVENELPRDDGGKDYFYPYWLRQMPKSQLWRDTADLRYLSIYEQIDGSGLFSWTDIEPTVNTLPFGSFAVNSKEDFIYSCLCQFSDRAGGSGVVANYASFGDLYDAIFVQNKIVPDKFFNTFPIAPI